MTWLVILFAGPVPLPSKLYRSFVSKSLHLRDPIDHQR